MMEILNTYYEHAIEFGLLMALATAGLIGFGFCVIFTVVKTKFNKKILSILATMSFLLAFLGYGSATMFEKDTYHEVIVVDADDFDFQTYEIIESRGKIITVKERG